MRSVQQYTLEDFSEFKSKLLHWGQQFEEAIWLDSNRYSQQYSSYDAVLAVDAFTTIKTDYYNGFDKLKEYQSVTSDWIFGYLSYDLKNDTEDLVSENKDELCFPDLYFFQPKKLFLLKGNILEMHYLRMVDDEMEEDFKVISEYSLLKKDITEQPCGKVKISLRITKDEYKEKVNEMLAHIHRGDIYEANFCQEFFAKNSCIDPLQTYYHLNDISKPPFATFFRMNDHYLLSASPERYLRKEGQKVISQPIKGTAKRSQDINEDKRLVSSLYGDPKERSENVMIVDLVRNDLSRTATKGSVIVEELCKVYSFKQVHQMISTVTSTINDTISPVDVIKTTFPMGSMTGAPKISAMQIIENLEKSKRGLYSGAVGYFTPDGDFDFNVVIRSILYNEERQYISYTVGGAITAKSDPDKEYEECLLKAKAMREVLERM
ncbi:para-aminobenzoate synthetase component 1 [Aquimarina sp. EL_43]|uniref:aminodeoxychorismate synthase component I n=1 Tax=unclassified Aquimarina TaxID=2627091 RepID=UPI0018CA8FF8|nr:MULTISPECIES: aminodeoxychorismate synthase component I [unclassified Aquimarina]MBG6132153.1 para-aminobenzoate synthetase component 1 [Aquimarina sp. EL_35]MBG6152950.1 para-aminobenzoate synthetase component 1 [Aquimarina sp. EL_32]MBG6170957.1 para-aminobenzoate synthetase component 1 [Aquimarina sp. EL_43]